MRDLHRVKSTDKGPETGKFETYNVLIMFVNT